MPNQCVISREDRISLRPSGGHVCFREQVKKILTLLYRTGAMVQ